MVFVTRSLNTCIYAAIGIDVALLLISVLYFLFATRYPDITFISDLLFHRLDYKVVVSTLVFFQIGTTFVYAFSRRQQHPIEFPFVFISLVIASVGWYLVAFVHISDDRVTRNRALVHTIGAKMYVYGHVASYACLVMNTWHRFQKSQTQKHFWFCIVVLVCYLQCGMFGMLYTMGTDSGWIYEQMIFISFHVAHLVFFVNTLKDDHDGIKYQREFNLFADVQLHPSQLVVQGANTCCVLIHKEQSWKQSMYLLMKTHGFLKGDAGRKAMDRQFVNNNFCFFTGMLVTASLFFVVVICLAELGGNRQGVSFFKLAIGVCSVGCLIALLMVLIYAYNNDYWSIMCAGMTCDLAWLVVFSVALVLFVHASPYVRGIMFLIIQSLDPMHDIGQLQDGTGIVPSLVVDDTSLRNGYATLTSFAQQTIIDHQTACQGARFIVANFDGMGMSALMHFYALVLARAIDEGKVFAWGDTACADFFGGNCRDFFMDEHGCPSMSITPNTIAEVITDVSTVMHASVPKVFRDVMVVLHPSMTNLQLKYWWKTQAVSYLMRLNHKTQAEVNAMRADPAVHPGLLGVIPPHTINIQMRRGDKYDEMGIPPVSKYIDRAAQLFNDMPFSFSRWVFLTGDELASLEYAAQLARDMNWGVIYSIYPRMEKGFVQSGMRAFGWTRNVTLTGLMDLDMSMDCAAWLGTRASGWSRLFDEFRCTKVPKCHNIFIEIGSLPSGQYAPQVQ